MSFFSKRAFTASAVGVFALSVAIPAFGQTAGSGNITGTVTDSAGAAVANATVLITDTDTGVARSVVTNGGGSYTAPFLQSGHYEIVFSGGSFGKVNRKNLVLTVGSTLTVDAALPAASVSAEVVVTSDSPLLDPEKVDASQTVTSELVSNLPVNGRRWDNFVLLTPNVAPDGSSGLISYRGISGLYNTNMVDGVNNQQALFNEARGRATGAPYVFSQDSIKEFQSSVSGYSAELGGAAGGVVNAITKSGANQIHGDLFYMLRYPSLNALDPYSKWSALHNGGNTVLLTQTIHQQQQFGGSIGGPIIKDKLFYFFTYDGFRRVNPILYTSSTGLSTLLGYANTASTAPATNATVLTAGTCPAPLSAAQCVTAANYLYAQTGTFPRNTKQDIFFPKLDYNLNSKNHISTSFLWQDFHLPNGYNTSTTVNNSSPTNNGTVNFHERFYVANWESVLSPTMANALHFQWSRDLETASANAPGPAVSIASVAQYGENLAIPREAEPDEHRIEFFDTVSKVAGHHTLKFGVDLNFIHEIMINLFQGNGNYTYSGTAAAAFTNWVSDVYGVNGGQHWQSFTQVVDPITKLGKDDFWDKNLSAFAEDSWKIVPKLTISAGVRWDSQLVPQPTRPYTTSANGSASPLGASVTSTIHTNYMMYQPRIGFAWNPLPKTVVRGGYGMFYGFIPLSAYYNVRVENGVYQQQYNFSQTVTGTTASYTAGAPSNMNVLFTPPGPALAAPFSGAVTPTAIGVPAGQALSPHGIDKNYTQPYTHSFDLAVEQQLTPKTSFTLSYTGTRGMRLPYSIDLNQAAWSGATRSYDVYNAAGTLTQTVKVPFYPATATKPSTGDGNFSVSYSGLNTWYNAMAVSVNQKMWYGFSGLFNYTWAHTSDPGQTAGSGGGAFFGTDVILDPFNRKELYPAGSGVNMTREEGRSDLDMRGRFVGSLIYESKFGISNHLIAYAANGWILGATITAQNGLPVTAFMATNPGTGVYTTGTGATASAAGGDGAATGGADNTNNAPSSAYGRAPNVGRNSFPGPGVHNTDVRISRDFPIHNSIKFQVVGEAFNIANHRNGLGVATTAYTYATPLATGGNTRIIPYASSTPFGTITSTSSTLYGPRQLQVSAKLFF